MISHLTHYLKTSAQIIFGAFKNTTSPAILLSFTVYIHRVQSAVVIGADRTTLFFGAFYAFEALVLGACLLSH